MLKIPEQARAYMAEWLQSWPWNAFRPISVVCHAASDPKMIKEIQDAVMSQHAGVRWSFSSWKHRFCRHLMIISTRVRFLTPADDLIHVDKNQFDVPFAQAMTAAFAVFVCYL